MKDQAENLREMISKIKSKRPEPVLELLHRMDEKKARVITVTSGKGGVGKTNITVNLAISFSGMGKRVAIIDADFGLANIDVLMGVAPRFTLLDVINGTRSVFEVLTSGPGNIKFISGGSGVRELIELGDTELKDFLDSIELLDRMFDIILIDTGAGISKRVLSFVMAADEVILVTTPEPTSITDAYALIKTIARKEANKIIKIIVNRVASEIEAEDVQNKLELVSERFLGMKIEPIGFIDKDDAVVKAVKNQVPFMVLYPDCRASRRLNEITLKLLEQRAGQADAYSGFKGFLRKFLKIESVSGKMIK